MPRYNDVETYTFVDINGNRYAVKGLREIPDEDTAFVLQTKRGDRVDEMASRADVYGDESEFESHRIVDKNVAKFIDSKFDIAKIRELDIPF